MLFSYSTITHYPGGDKQTVWSIDASVPLFSLKFTILFITCLVLFFILLFCVTLLSGKFLLKFIAINHFKSLFITFYDPYKAKYYYWVSITLVFRNLFFSLYAFQSRLRGIFSNYTSVVALTACHGYACPHKSKAVNI